MGYLISIEICTHFIFANACLCCFIFIHKVARVPFLSLPPSYLALPIHSLNIVVLIYSAEIKNGWRESRCLGHCRICLRFTLVFKDKKSRNLPKYVKNLWSKMRWNASMLSKRDGLIFVLSCQMGELNHSNRNYRAHRKYNCFAFL